MLEGEFLKIIRFGFKVLMHRPLFKNYYRLALKHAMLRLGLIKDGYVTIRCFDSSSTQTTLYTVGKLIYSYVIGYVNGINCLGNNVRFFDGSLIPISEIMFGDGIGDALRYGWRYDADNGYWFRDNIKFKHMHVPIIENFSFDQYGVLNVKDRVVVDVGAFVGDSAIYFVLRGAKKVYAVEPHPGAYQEMLENIRLNNLKDRIIPINAALGSKHGIIKIPSVDIDSTGVMYYGLSNSGNFEVPMITLEQLIKEYNIEPDVLKMDCEGCEFDIILNDYANVRKFNEAIIEYHTNYTKYNITELINILKQDFKCMFVNEEFYRSYFKRYTRNELGMLYCVKSLLG